MTVHFLLAYDWSSHGDWKDSACNKKLNVNLSYEFYNINALEFSISTRKGSVKPEIKNKII